MVFSSALFLIYFLPAFLIGYYLLPHKLRNLWLLTASVFFYTWGAPKFIFIVLGSIFADYFLIKEMAQAEGMKKKWFIAVSLVMNIGLLAYFKYANFFIYNANNFLNSIGIGQVAWTSIALPIGISFFTFQKITYSVDVYRNVHKPLHRLTDYAMYILMFPHLIAGPIVQFHLVADQIENRKYNETLENHLLGFFRFVIGLSKKVLIANVLGTTADQIFAMDTVDLGSGTAWLGVMAYAFQIYFDFSGYSDMAIGLALMIGFKFPENFNNPYISQNISEFWRRWHMTLGRFMKDYLYIPLGGNRVKPARMYFNLWLVFLLSGLWHGAAWNFLAWGAFQGVFLVADRLFLIKLLQKLGKVPSILFTFFVTLIGWVLFRGEGLRHSAKYLKSMFSFAKEGQLVDFDQRFWIILGFAILFSFFAAFGGVEKWQEKVLGSLESRRHGGMEAWKLEGMGPWRVLFALVFFILCLAAVISSGFNPFIYFRF
jgi:alginate O-acetyltransferase complex protein AlgI